MLDAMLGGAVIRAVARRLKCIFVSHFPSFYGYSEQIQEALTADLTYIGRHTPYTALEAFLDRADRVDGRLGGTLLRF